MNWITNVLHDEADAAISIYNKGRPGVRIEVGPPKETVLFTVERLVEVGAVGLYEAEA